MKKKKLLLFITIFIVGFLTHALLFPNFLRYTITDVSQKILPDNNQAESDNPLDPLITRIYFDGKSFSRKNVNIGFTRYIQIINKSKDSLMSLESNNPDLRTPRGYGLGEALQAQFNKKGEFIVADKNNPQEKLIITVK